MAKAAFILAGPTASGKSAVVEHLAAQRGCAILSTDSMQVYRGMDMGTAKPDARIRSIIEYGGIDLVSPAEDFNIWRYLDCARDFAAQHEGQPFIAAGGTGLYIRALVQGLDDGPGANPRLRAELDRLLERGGVRALQTRLRMLDPEAHLRLADPENPRRLIRAIERAAAGHVAKNPGTRPARQAPGAVVPVVVLNPDREQLCQRIERRAKAMFEGGLLEEVRGLRERYPRWSTTACQAIGYSEALAVLDQRVSVDEAVEQTVIRTRRLAKRQMTWFRTQVKSVWVDLNGAEPVEHVADRVSDLWENYGPVPLSF